MLLITTKARQRQREDEAWSDGYTFGEDEVEEAIAGKDDFIAHQAAIISELLGTEAIDWTKVPTKLQSHLADYV